MLKKISGILAAFVLTAVLCATAAAQSLEKYEPATASALTSAKLPSGALRIAPASVPPEIEAGLERIVEAGEGRLVEGEREVFAWTGEDYTKAKAGELIAQLTGNLSAGGWKYKTGGTRGDVTFFNALAEKPKRRAVVGFFVATEEGLLLAWMEVLQAKTAE